MIEQILDIPTKDGAIETFICHPERGGPYPPVFFLMDAPGIREELRDMARRLATVGYYVLLPNLYYRAGRDTIYGPTCWSKGSAEHARMRAVRTKMTIPPVMDDIAAMLAFVDRQEAVKPGPVGAHGYCMSGPYSLAAAARYPDRIAAAASFYGTWLVSDAVESPHLTLGKVKGELYIACAEHDELAPPEWSRSCVAVHAGRCAGRDRALPRRPSRLRLPAALVLRQAGRRTPLGAPDRALSPKTWAEGGRPAQRAGASVTKARKVVLIGVRSQPRDKDRCFYTACSRDLYWNFQPCQCPTRG